MAKGADEETLNRWMESAEQPLVDIEYGTYRLSDFLGWQRDGTLELRPHYQRGSVWNERNKSFLIDSLVRGYPLPLIVLQDEIYSDSPTVRKRVVDGQQRLRTLFAFVEPSLLDHEEMTELDMGASDDFRYHPPDLDLPAGLAYSDLPEPTRRRIMTARLPTVLLSTAAMDGNILEVYDRLNSTGLGLNAQELRYARRSGEFADFCYRFARANQARWTGWKLFKPKDISRMMEVQFASELVLLAMNGVDKTGKKEIDEAYSDEKLASNVPNEARIEQDLQQAMDLIDDFLVAPTSPDPIRMFRTKGWFYSLFALTMKELGALGEDLRPLAPSKRRKSGQERALRSLEFAIDAGPAKLAVARKSNPELVRAISGGASDKAARVRRVGFLGDDG